MIDIMERLSQWYAATGAPAYKEGADEIERLRAMNAELLAALENVRSLITEAAMMGFNYAAGDWPTRLFESQQITSKAVAKAKP